MLQRITPRIVWPPFRRTWLAWVILAWFMGGGARAQSAPAVPFASDLAVDAALARRQHLSLLILFSLPSCPYCREVIRDYLVPMQRDPAYRRKILIRQVEIDSTAMLRDFSGKETTQRRFARRYRVKLAPTIVLVDAQGRLLAKPLVGVTIPDYYGGFLDEAIDQAWRRVRHGSR